MRSSAERIRIEVLLRQRRSAADFEELRRGLESRPRRLPSKYFYDRRGSRLFERITRLPEYYLTRAERRLLKGSAEEICRLSEAEELVELGSGAASKTRILLDAMQRAGRLRLYVPFDVSESEVLRVARELTAEYPRLRVHGLVADFTRHLTAIPEGEPRLVALLGSTLGNYGPERAAALLRRVSASMAPGDYFLLGADLVKEVERLEAAYNDAAGVTAEFNRNILRVVNAAAAADFEPSQFAHRAFFDPEKSRIEMRLEALRPMRVTLAALDLSLDLAAGEELLTEISTKYDRAGIEALFAASRFELQRWYTGRRRSFALALARRAA